MISKDKQYRTRDGREVRIYATDGHPHEPVHGALKDYNGDWNHAAWLHDGRNIYDRKQSDLIEVKPRIKRELWIAAFDKFEVIFRTEEEAKQYAQYKAPLACVKIVIDCEEGEGL